jgi:hypothetical protein
MTDVTRLTEAASELLRLDADELRKLAAAEAGRADRVACSRPRI